MHAWPKSILMLGANVLTARTALGLRRDGSAHAQRSAYRRLVQQLAGTSYWHDAGITPGLRYQEFRARVQPRRYEELQPAINRMQQGETNVLWPGHCALFALSAGTTLGVPKALPVTSGMLAHFRAGERQALLFYTARMGHAGVLRGRHLFLTGSTTLQPVGNPDVHRAFAGEWPAIAALNPPRWVEAEPGAEIAQMTDWQAKLEATVSRTLTRDLSLIAGIPTWILGFAEAVRAKRAEAGQPAATLDTVWPNLECMVHTGQPISPYLTELRDALGPDVNFHEVYAGAEGFYAAQDAAEAGELRVMANLGLFFEFIPLADFDPTRTAALGEKAVALADVKRGIDYVVLLTTPAGLARYLVGDIVRFTSVQPPRLTWVGRTELMLSAFGEQVIERDVRDALLAVCQRHRWKITNFHVSPLFGLNLTGQSRGRHEWWIELKPGTIETPTGPQMAMELDFELQRINRSYSERRATARIDSPTVRLVMPGVFKHWMRFHGNWGGQHKVARCRSDRQIADELAQITKFARDQG